MREEIETLAERVVSENQALARDAAAGVPKTWGALAARGIVALKERLRRAPTEAERRAMWDALWRALHGSG